MTRILLVLIAGVFLISCAEEEKVSNNPVTINVDEDGIPMGCDLIEDSIFYNLFEGVDSVSRTSEDLKEMVGQRCNMGIHASGGGKLGQIIIIVKQREEGVNREGAAKRSKNTKYLDDLPFPASWRTFSNLRTMVFDHGNYTVSMNVGGFPSINEENLLSKCKIIATEIVENLKANEL